MCQGHYWFYLLACLDLKLQFTSVINAGFLVQLPQKKMDKKLFHFTFLLFIITKQHHWYKNNPFVWVKLQICDPQEVETLWTAETLRQCFSMAEGHTKIRPVVLHIFHKHCQNDLGTVINLQDHISSRPEQYTITLYSLAQSCKRWRDLQLSKSEKKKSSRLNTWDTKEGTGVGVGNNLIKNLLPLVLRKESYLKRRNPTWGRDRAARTTDEQNKPLTARDA